MNELVKELMKEMSRPEVISWIKESFSEVEPDEYENILLEEFGMEPDYIFDALAIVGD